jgi:hypothetical protein
MLFLPSLQIVKRTRRIGKRYRHLKTRYQRVKVIDQSLRDEIARISVFC